MYGWWDDWTEYTEPNWTEANQTEQKLRAEAGWIERMNECLLYGFAFLFFTLLFPSCVPYWVGCSYTYM